MQKVKDHLVYQNAEWLALSTTDSWSFWSLAKAISGIILHESVYRSWAIKITVKNENNQRKRWKKKPQHVEFTTHSGFSIIFLRSSGIHRDPWFFYGLDTTRLLNSKRCPIISIVPTFLPFAILRLPGFDSLDKANVFASQFASNSTPSVYFSLFLSRSQPCFFLL